MDAINSDRLVAAVEAIALIERTAERDAAREALRKILVRAERGSVIADLATAALDTGAS